MTADLDLTFACWGYDRTRPLSDGRVRPRGIALRYLDMSPAETFWRQVRHLEFDANEMSLSGYIMSVARGDDRYVGLPAFTSRVFRHGHIYVRKDGPTDGKDLKGHRIGVPEYHMTASLFMRGLLHDEFGIQASDVEWVQAGAWEPGREEREKLELPGEIKVTVDREHTLDELVEAGEVTALLNAYEPRSFKPDGSGVVRRLYPNPIEASLEYYQRTGIYPIMHLVVLRRELHERYPWVARNFMDALIEAKDMAMQEMKGYGGHSMSMLPFFIDRMEEASHVFGEDIWPYGVESSRPTIEAAVRYSYEQGLSKRQVGVDELFAESVLDSYVD